MDRGHWLSIREIFGDPDLGLPASGNSEADQEYARGVSCMEQGDVSGAEQAFRRSDELGHAGAPRELALSAFYQGDMDPSGEWGELLARARERGDGHAASWLGRIGRDEPDRGLDHLRFSDETGDPEGSRELGLALKAGGDLAEAEAAFRRSDERGSASGSLALGLFLRDERNDVHGAEAAFLRAAQRGHPKGSLNLMDIYLDRGDNAAAEEAGEQALRLAAKHRTLFDEMQDPDFVAYVRGRYGKATATSATGSGCAVVAIAAIAACGVAMTAVFA